MLAPVAPFDHITVPAQPLAVIVTDSPLQMFVVEHSKVGANTLVTPTVTAFETLLFTSAAHAQIAV